MSTTNQDTTQIDIVSKDIDVLVLSYYDQRFWELGRQVPTLEKAALDLGIPVGEIEQSLKKANVRAGLKSRGIDLESLVSESDLLTPIQLLLVNMILNSHDKTSLREKLVALEISSQQYHAWLRDPRFAGYLRKRAEMLFSASDFIAYQKILENVESGDVPSLKMFVEMRKIHTPSTRVHVDIDPVGIINQIVSILTRHIHDNILLNKIADDIENEVLGAASGTDQAVGRGGYKIDPPEAFAGVIKAQSEILGIQTNEKPVENGSVVSQLSSLFNVSPGEMPSVGLSDVVEPGGGASL